MRRKSRESPNMPGFPAALYAPIMCTSAAISAVAIAGGLKPVNADLKLTHFSCSRRSKTDTPPMQ